MVMRTHFCRVLFFTICFFTLSPHAAMQNNIIPAVIVTKPKEYSLSSSPKVLISKQDIATSGATSLSQALEELGGVQLEDTTGNGSQVMLSMRGFGVNATSNTLLLVNGIPLSNPDLAPPDLNAIPLNEIETIEIINGSESVLYGDQAVGGIINIITHDNDPKKIVASCSAGSYNQQICSASISKKIQKMNFSLQLLHNQTDNYRVHNNYNQTLIGGNVNYPYKTGSWNFDYKIVNEKMLYPGALTQTQVEQNRRQATNETDFFSDWNGLFNFRHTQKLNSNWKLQTDLSRREMHGSGVLFSPFLQSRYIHYIKPQVKGTINGNILTSGIELQNDSYNLNSYYGVTNNSLQKYGLFGLIDIPLTSRLTLSLGARGAQQDTTLTQNNSVTNRVTATTIGATYTLTQHAKIYLRRAESFRFPNADENAFIASNITQLKTQKGSSYETGAEWDWKSLTSKINLYLLQLTNEITFDPTQTLQTPFGANRNLAPTQRQGFSLSEKYDFNSQLSLNGQYNFVNARFQSGINSGNRIPLVAENLLRAGVNYQFLSHWNIYTEAQYTGNQYTANDDANIAGKMGGYTTYNTSLRFSYKSLSASLRLNNIFNKYYYFYTVFNPTMNSQSFYPAPGRNYMLTLKYEMD